MPPMTAAQAARAVPAVRHALRAAGVPGWLLAALRLAAKWLPIIIAIIVQVAPLFLSGTYLPPVNGPDPLADPAVDDAVKDTIRAAQGGTLDD